MEANFTLPPIASRKTGYAAKHYERTKLKLLQKLRMSGDNTPAIKVITPVIFELTGGAGKLANNFFRFLAEIQFPGSKGQSKDNPRLQRQRALFIMHERRLCSFAIARNRAHFMLLKRELIRKERARCVSVKFGGTDDDSSILNRRVGIQSIDVEAPFRGVPDCCDVPSRGPSDMAPDDAELERLVAADEEERDRLMADLLGVDAEGSEGEEGAGGA